MLGNIPDGVLLERARLSSVDASRHFDSFVSDAFRRKRSVSPYWASAPSNPWILRSRRLSTPSPAMR
jgi:hypothetical protein